MNIPTNPLESSESAFWTSQEELLHAQLVTRQQLPDLVSEEALLVQYPTSFEPPQRPDAYIKSIAGNEDAESLVEEKANSEFDATYPIDKDGYQAQIEVKNTQILTNDQRALEAQDDASLEPVTEEIAIADSKYPNVHRSLGTKFLFGSGVFGGYLVMGATIFNLMSESDVVPWMYDYPYLAYIFAFIPISMSLVIAQAYRWFNKDRHKNAYLGSLFLLSLASSAAWMVTFGPAYAGDTDSLDLSASSGSNIYAIHMSIQLCCEILIGALLKIALMHLDRATRKTEIRETSASKQHRLTVAILNAQNEPLRTEITAISKHLSAHSAARQSFIGNCLAQLRSIQDDNTHMAAMADAVAHKSRLDHVSSNKSTD